MKEHVVYTVIDTPEAPHREGALMRKVFPLHKMLRTHFSDFDSYIALMRKVLAGSAAMMVAQQQDGDAAGLALYRMHYNTYQNKLFFLEDLVTEESLRGQGVGSALLQRCEEVAKENGCSALSLDSGTFRTRAHKFYYLHGYVADCFHFSKTLS